MKHIKSIITVLAVTGIAGVVVWQLMWMQEVKQTSNVKQLLDEAEQIEEGADLKPGHDRKAVHRKDYTGESMPVISAEQSVPQLEQRRVPQTADIPEKIIVQPEAAQPDTVVPVQEDPYENRVDQITRNQAPGEQETQQLRYDTNKVKNVTIKGSAPSRYEKKPVISTARPAQHPTSTSP